MNKTERRLLEETAETVSRLQSEITELKNRKKFHYRLSFYYCGELKQFDLYMDYPLSGSMCVTYNNHIYYIKTIRYIYVNSIYLLDLAECASFGLDRFIIDLTGL